MTAGDTLSRQDRERAAIGVIQVRARHSLGLKFEVRVKAAKRTKRLKKKKKNIEDQIAAIKEF